VTPSHSRSQSPSRSMSANLACGTLSSKQKCKTNSQCKSCSCSKGVCL
jgi:hypothetical protein